MAVKTEVENVTRSRMVGRDDISEYQQSGWKFVKNVGKQSAIMEKTEKIQVPVVDPKHKEKDVKSKE